MIKCDGIDKKKSEKCNSPAKYTINIDDKTCYRCGRHSRNMNKVLIENTDDIVKEIKKREQKPKILKSDENGDEYNDNKKLNIEKEEYSDIQEKLSYQNENINNINYEKNNKYKKIDELCNLLNNNNINNKQFYSNKD